MDIQALSALLKTQQAAASNFSTQAEKLLALESKSGTLIQALVTDAIQINGKEQQALIQLLKQQLASLSPQTEKDQSTPAQISIKPEQQRLITGLQARLGLIEKSLQEKALLQLVTLKLGPQHIKTLSDKLFTVGETINLRVRVDGQLTLLANNQLAGKAQTSAQPVSNASPYSTFNSTTGRNETAQRIAESLREYLPRSADNIRSVQTLDKFIQSIIKINPSLRAPLIPDVIHLLVSKLVSNALNPSRLQLQTNTIPPNVKNLTQEIKLAVGKSGSVLENNLRRLLSLAPEQLNRNTNSNESGTRSTSPVSSSIQPNAQSGRLENESKLLLQPKSITAAATTSTRTNAAQALGDSAKISLTDTLAQLFRGPASSANPSESNTKISQTQTLTNRVAFTKPANLLLNPVVNSLNSKPFSHTAPAVSPTSLTQTTPTTSTPQDKIDDDSKAILLKLIEHLDSAGSNNTHLQQLQSGIQRTLQDPLLAILKSLGLSPKKDATVPQLQKEAISELKQLVSSTLARIQTLQLRSLSQGINDINSRQLPAVELSIRVNENIFPLILYFQEKPVKEKTRDDEEEEKSKRKRKLTQQWKVFMQFEMDDCGWFASEVSLLDEKVSTRFWAQQDSTKSLMKNRLESLKKKMEASGLFVEDVSLLPGDPPVPNTPIQQNLVDIQT